MRLDEAALLDYAHGTAVLGGGAGGVARAALSAARHAVRAYGPIPVVRPDELPGDALVVPVAAWGTADRAARRLGSPSHGSRLRRLVERERGERVHAVIASEIGGSNALMPAIWAAHMGLPLVDADGMGRAFPSKRATSMEVSGVPATPGFLVDEYGHQLVLRDMDTWWWEHTTRAAAKACGGAAATASHLLTGARTGEATVVGSVTRALRIGGALAHTRGSVPTAIPRVGGRVVVTGEIGDTERRDAEGEAHGHVLIDGVGEDRGRLVRLESHHTNHVVLEDGRVLASAPDIITVFDGRTGRVLDTAEPRRGRRVTVAVLPAPDIWRTAAGLELAGPRAFGYEIPYRPMEQTVPERSPGTV